MTTLILTLGGSPDPVVHAIEQNRPDRVIFIGSRDPDKPDDGFASSVTLVPGVLARAGFPEAQAATEPVVKPDDFLDVWQVCERIAAAAEGRVIANYTGGTKTMSAALAAFALLHDWELQAQVARRTDLIRVTANDRRRLQAGVHVARMQLALRQARAFAARGDFEGAINLLETAPSAQHDVGDSLQGQIDQLIAECRFRDALDRFDYDGAEALLRAPENRLGAAFGRSHGRHLAAIRETLAWLASPPGAASPPRAPFTVAEDLLDNAARVAARGRYDDAFSRLYRATELIAQVALRAGHGLATADVDRARLPEGFPIPSDPPPGEPLKIGLMRSYELLAALGDPIGVYFDAQRNALRTLLPLRNASWLAHGFTPVSADTWRDHGETWLAWLRGALTAAR